MRSREVNITIGIALVFHLHAQLRTSNVPGYNRPYAMSHMKNGRTIRNPASTTPVPLVVKTRAAPSVTLAKASHPPKNAVSPASSASSIPPLPSPQTRSTKLQQVPSNAQRRIIPISTGPSTSSFLPPSSGSVFSTLQGCHVTQSNSRLAKRRNLLSWHRVGGRHEVNNWKVGEIFAERLINLAVFVGTSLWQRLTAVASCSS
ncbi:hypothetical protein CVT26_003356 [Gymnopilus dilepis]|uniref:Uncharacterized protein n=1 Tax=Gymnopilus dilepis TaxID=231916 RepID=A0A409VQN0_9AGAR|nr:hypothetical protein CVT26_003356 [Gymnopilus dilepis]